MACDLLDLRAEPLDSSRLHLKNPFQPLDKLGWKPKPSRSNWVFVNSSLVAMAIIKPDSLSAGSQS